MFKPDRHHIIIAVKTLVIQALLFCSILFVVWGSQKLYGLIDQTRFPTPYQVTVTEGMTDEQKGKELIDALTARMQYELHSTFGWSANDILFNPYVLDNRAYRQFGTYYATKTLLDHYSTVIAKLGSSDRENQSLYDARVNDFTFGPKRWGYFFVPSAESAYKRGLKRVEKYKQELDEGKRKSVFPAEQEAGQGSAQHVAHGDIEQGQKEAEGSGHTPLHGVQLTGHRVLPDGGGSGLLGAGGPGRVARLTDGGRDALRRQDTLVVFHLHTVGQQVHLHGPHALQLAHGLFHVSGAGGAGHTSYVKFLFHRIHLTDTPLGWGGFIIAQGEGSVKIQDRFQIQL